MFNRLPRWIRGFIFLFLLAAAFFFLAWGGTVLYYKFFVTEEVAEEEFQPEPEPEPVEEPEPEPEPEPEEPELEPEPEPEPEFRGSVQTIGVNEYGLLQAHVHTPGAGSLHWEDAQGMVASDTITWEDPLTGDIELSPIGETNGLVPVLIPQGEEPIKGKPIP